MEALDAENVLRAVLNDAVGDFPRLLVRQRVDFAHQQLAVAVRLQQGLLDDLQFGEALLVAALVGRVADAAGLDALEETIDEFLLVLLLLHELFAHAAAAGLQRLLELLAVLQRENAVLEEALHHLHSVLILRRLDLLLQALRVDELCVPVQLAALETLEHALLAGVDAEALLVLRVAAPALVRLPVDAHEQLGAHRAGEHEREKDSGYRKFWHSYPILLNQYLYYFFSLCQVLRQITLHLLIG